MDKGKVLADAMKRNDPWPLTDLGLEELEKLRVAEEILEARHAAEKRANRLANVGAMLVGYVALAGFFANAYQNYLNKQHLNEQAAREEERWKQEFDRTRRADKYRAFFETSALVTDSQSQDRRLVGLALMDEFVADPDYHEKAVAILDQALAHELKESEKEADVVGLSEERRGAITEIVRAMSATSSCHELQRAADSIGRVVSHARKDNDPQENLELLTLYSRRLVGRAAVICKTSGDFIQVRNPVRDALLSVGGMDGLSKDATRRDGSVAVAHLLVKTCAVEAADYGGHECVDIRTHYLELCKLMEKEGVRWEKEKPACGIVLKWPAAEDAPLAVTTTPE